MSEEFFQPRTHFTYPKRPRVTIGKEKPVGRALAPVTLNKFTAQLSVYRNRQEREQLLQARERERLQAVIRDMRASQITKVTRAAP